MRGTGLRAAALAVALLVAGWPSATRTQTPPASLLADNLAYDEATGLLTASGNVEVYHLGRVLRARRIVYDAEADEISVEGPMTLSDTGGTVLLADAATLSGDLAEGLVSGARLLVDRQLQLAAGEVRRSGGRFTTLNETVASSCTICAENPTPTWAVRAARVTMDEAARRIYFENAIVQFFGFPVAWLPQFSIPDPTVRRASGFLLPSYQQSNIYGFGFKLPYYRVLGEYADATVTPFVTTKGAFLLEGEYRRRFARGGFDIDGVFAIDDGLGGGAGRGFLNSVGEYRLRGGFIADYDINLVSDKDFLQQFDYSDADILTSIGRLRRTRAFDDYDLQIIGFKSLREGEDTSQVPFILPQFYYRRHVEAPGGGRFGIDVDVLGVVRSSGTDMLRTGGGADWRGDWITPQGIVAAASAFAPFDVYQVRDDPDDPDRTQARVVPGASVELRWPLVRNAGRTSHVIEPIVQLVYSDIIGATDVPNEDSLLPELDETNLFSLNRFPGRDRYETGLRANYGINYSRYDPAGWSLGLLVGGVLRSQEIEDFDTGTGLAGTRSDLVGSLSVDFDWGLSMVNRALFDETLTFRRNEFALAWDAELGDLAAAYIYLSPDASNPAIGPQPETNEVLVDARYRVRPNWEISGNWRYDVATNSPLRAGGGIAYGNECAVFDLSVSRRFTSSSNVPPSTSFAFGVRLAGLGESEERSWPTRACGRRGT